MEKMNKDLMDNKGKASLKNHRTQSDEAKTLARIARKMKTQNDKFEKENSFAIVPINKGYKKVVMEKFLKNQRYYEKIATGKIKFENPKKQKK